MKWMHAVAVLAALAACVAPSSVFASADPLLVETQGGKVLGTAAPNGVRAYRGIPFAEPPVGPLRFRAPVPASPWGGVLDASSFQPACMQQSVQAFLPEFALELPSGVSEDCLYLNVFAPTNGTGLRDVAVYLDDKSWVEGSTSSYELYRMAEAIDSVVVSIAVRTQTFGAFNLQGYAETDSNNWFADEEMGLKWIHNNIHAFGGNKERVTLVATSRGASSILHHLEVQGGKIQKDHLFDSAVMTSPIVAHPTIFEMQARSVQHAASLGCSGDSEDILVCMQALPAETVVTADGRYQASWGHGTRFPVQHVTAFREGLYDTNAKLVMGHSQSEGDIYILSTYIYLRLLGGTPPQNVTLISPNDPAFPMEAAIASIYYLIGNVGLSQDSITQIFYYYMATMPGKGFGEIASRIIHDGTVCGIDFITDHAVSHGSKLFRYEFAHSPDFPIYPELGCTHESNMPFALGEYDLGSIANHQSWSPEEQALSAYLQAEIDSFTKTGSPSAEWKQYKLDDKVGNRVTKASPGGIELVPMGKVAACDAVWSQHFDAVQ